MIAALRFNVRMCKCRPRSALLCFCRSFLSFSWKVPSSFATASDFVFAYVILCTEQQHHQLCLFPQETTSSKLFQICKTHQRFVKERKALHGSDGVGCRLDVSEHHPCLSSKSVCLQRNDIYDLPKLREDSVETLLEICCHVSTN